MVQNFLASLDTNITENDLVEKILQMFSDIPMTTQAIKKLKEMRQAENESILAFNQRYKTLVERVEGRPIELITSPVVMEMYLGTIIPPLRRSIKNSIFWGSKHAPNTVGEAMAKAQQLYVKHLYATGDGQDEDQVKPVEDVIINEISRKFENRYRGRRDDFRDSSRNRQENYDNDQRRWQPYNDRKNFSYSPKFNSPQQSIGTESRNDQRHSDSSMNRHEAEGEQECSQRQNTDRQIDPHDRADDSTRRQNRKGQCSKFGTMRRLYTDIGEPHAAYRS